jgi:hypothetical protein
MTEPTLDTLTQRLDRLELRLELQTRSLNRALLALLVTVYAAMDVLYRQAALQIWDSIIGFVALIVVGANVDFGRLGRLRLKGTGEGSP